MNQRPGALARSFLLFKMKPRGDGGSLASRQGFVIYIEACSEYRTIRPASTVSSM